MAKARYGLGIVSAVLLVACLVTGCPAHVPGHVDTYDGKVYFVGDMTGFLQEEIELIFPNVHPYDNVSTDAPIFVSLGEVATMSNATKAGLNLAFQAHMPIVGVYMGEAEINALLGVLGLEQNYVLPEGMSFTEFFAVDLEEEGYLFTWSMYSPDEDDPQSEDPNAPALPAYVYDAKDKLARTGLFGTWLGDDDDRVTPEIKQMQTDAKAALASSAKAAGSELTQVAQGYVTTHNFADRGNNYQVSYFIYSCHSFTATDATGYDWFYVRQEGMFNATSAYNGVKDWYMGFPRSHCHYYVGNYKLDNWLQSLDHQNSGVALMVANPQNTNNEASVTSGINWNIGGSVGFSGKNATGSLSGGVTITNSTTVHVKDCEVINNSASKVHNASWDYAFKRCEQVKLFGYTDLKAPPVLSRSNFQPVNQWIWKFAPSIRDSNKACFNSSFKVDLVHSNGGQPYGFWGAGDPDHYLYDGGNWNFTVPLTFPPLLVVQHNLDLTAAGQNKALDIAASRDWVASSDQSWCRVEPASGTAANPHVNITVDPNTTGASRTATISFATVDGRGSDKMAVYQAQY
jgi:hypothetical protein